MLAPQHDTKECIDLLSTLGLVVSEQRGYQEAGACLDEAILAAECINYQEGLAFLYATRGLLTVLEGDLTLAEHFLLKVFPLQQLSSTSRIQVQTIANLGTLYERKGDFTRAHSYLQEAQSLARTFKHRDVLIDTYYYFGRVAYYQGDYASAKRLYEEAIGEASGQYLQRIVFLLLIRISQAVMKMGDFAQALAYQQEANSLLAQKSQPTKMCYLLSAQILLALEQHNLPEVHELLHTALDLARQRQHQEYYSEFLLQRGTVCQRGNCSDLT
jgi:tetratricopeptide (TPR) repeat protein